MFDELWPGGPRFLQAPDAFPLGTDSVLLADFANTARAKQILDLGCGAGVLTVLLAEKAPGARLCGVEILPDSAAICRKNLSANGHDPSGILTGDLREHRALYPAGAFDLVVSNPPYFAAGSGYSAPNDARAAARDERNCTLDELCQAAAYLTRWGGLFTLVHRPERLSELFCTLTRHGLEPKRLRMVQYQPHTPPNLVLAEARRGGNPGLSVLPPLILANADGLDTPEIRRIYHRGERI
ncbi:MAG: methyltransferase [Oscillospiraceae bacterium]|jgi:tRNA1Val (adenine37-N6)-methyltransferase|nr:methyltransferase [Oscillospiraceae bacterium]